MIKSKPQRWALSGGLVAPEWREMQRGLVIAAPFWEGGGDPYDYQGRRLGARTSVTWGVGPYGTKLTFASANNRVEWADAGDLNDLTGDLSILLIWKRNAGTGFRTLVSKRSTGQNASFLANFSQGSVLQWGYGDGGTFRVISTSDIPAVGEWVVMVCTRIKGGVNKIFLDGVEKASGSLTQTPDDTSIAVQMGVYNTTFEDYSGDMALFMLWKRNLSPGEVIAISRDPFGPIRTWRPSSAKAGGAAPATIVKDLLGGGIIAFPRS